MENESCETGASEPQSHLDMLPIKKGTDQLCESIVNQEGFKELYAKIDAFISDEKLKYEYSTLNERGALLQQKQQGGRPARCWGGLRGALKARIGLSYGLYSSGQREGGTTSR